MAKKHSKFSGVPGKVKGSTHVPDQYLGYAMQATRALTRLANGEPGQIISLEVFDDVGVENADGTKTAEQGKRARTTNPVSDRAVDIWKTFANWADAVTSGELPIEQTYFELYVSPPRSGTIVKSFDRASNFPDALAAVQSAQALFIAKPSRDADVQAQIDRAFRDPNLLAKIVARFNLIEGEKSSFDDLENALARHAIREDLLPHIMQNLIGWSKLTIERQIEQGLPAVISFGEFKSELVSLIGKFGSEHFLPCFATAPVPAMIEAEITFRTYIQQLKLVEMSEDDLVTAAASYLQASIDRTEWAQRAIVHDTSFEEFTIHLIETWRNKKRRVEIANKSLADIEKGQLTLLDCLEHQSKLQGKDVPHYFVPGCFHELADERRLGWHPDFELKLGNK